MKKSMTPQYLTPHEVASILKLSYDSTLNFIRNSGIPYIKVGRQYRVSQDALTAFLGKNSSIEIQPSKTENNKK